MNLLYLAVGRYSKMLIKEIILMLQIIILAYSFSYSMCYVFESTASIRYAQKTFQYEVAYFAFGERFDSELAYEIWTNNYLESSELFCEVFDQIPKLRNLKGVGRASGADIVIKDTTQFGPSISNEYGAEYDDWYLGMTQYNQDLILYAPLSVSKGRWFNDLEAQGVDSRSVIPVVVGAPFSNDLSVGDEIEADLRVYTLNYINKSDDEVECSLEEKRAPVVLKVIGILSKDAMPYRLNYGGTFQTMGCVFGPHEESMDNIFAPAIFFNNSRLQESYFGSVGCNLLLFTEDVSEVLADWRNIMGGYGSVDDLDSLVANEARLFKSGGRVYALYTIFSALLILIGVGGYNVLSLKRQQKSLGIYFMCGMSWRKAIAIALFSNAMIFVVGAIGGILLGITHVQTMRHFMMHSLWMAAALTFTIIFIIYVITSLVIVIGMIRMQPSMLIRKGSE